MSIIIICLILVLVVLTVFLILKKFSKKNESYNKHKSITESILDFINEQPEFTKVIAEENRKKAEKEPEEDAKYNYPIKMSKAIEIAKKNNTLKTDFCRNSDREGISYLSFNDYKTDLVNLNNKKYWQFQVLSGDISWISNKKNETIYNDGWLGEDDLKFLRCLIDVETGDYSYFPETKKYKERTVSYKDAINGIVKINEQPPEWLTRIMEE